MSEGSVNRPNDYLSRLEPDPEDPSEFTDQWDNSELLFLASSVLRSDRNWISVSRSIKPFGEQTRPADWYTPKNCAFQYNKLLGEIEDDSKKREVRRMDRETSEVRLVRTLTERRLNELTWLSQQTKQTASSLKSYIDLIQNSDLDDNELEDLICKIDEFDKTEEEFYNYYVAKRNKLMLAKKLNTSKIKGKTKTKTIDIKKKLPSFSDQLDDSSLHSPLKDIQIKKEPEDTTPKPSPSKPDTPLTLNALLDTKVTTASESPLLTSLLRSISSPPQTPLVCSPSKESRDVSPRSSVPPSPRSATASSPMLNSLLKNSPSSNTPIQLSPVKDTSPKITSLPQSFFASTGQQLVVSTSAASLGQQFFQVQELADGKKVTVRTSPATSACMSAPTLSKLLEMPPSSPGRLPPLPILDLPTPQDSAPKPKQATPIKKPPVLEDPDLNFIPDTTVLLKSSASYSMADRKSVSSESSVGEKVVVPSVVESSHRDSNVILEEISEVFNQACVEIESRRESALEDDGSKDILESIVAPDSVNILSPSSISLEPVSASHVEEVEISDCILGDSHTFVDDSLQQKISSVPGVSPSKEVSEMSSDKSLDAAEDDKGASPKKFYKNRLTKKDEVLEKYISDVPKKIISAQLSHEDSSSMIIESDDVSTSVDVVTADTDSETPLVSKSDNSKSPVSKKPRLYERLSTEKKELSEDEVPPVGRRPGRKAKKGRGRGARTPVKVPKPEEVFEFSESSMEENSTGYKAKNKTCYTPRSREESHSESQDFEDAPSDVTTPTEKKFSTPTRNKQGKTPLGSVDEERMSDSFASDEASGHLANKDKLMKWMETSEEQEEKHSSEGSRRGTKVVESPKKKGVVGKRGSLGKGTPQKKDKKQFSVDMEDLSAGSRDSVELSSAQEKEDSEGKASICPIPMDMESETNDIPSSSAAESDKQMEENDESLQGSGTTDISPPATAEIKNEKDAPQFGKQDWFHLASPKSTDGAWHSSEDSEGDESDNWDNQSVRTNNSTSQSAGMHSRLKRKERETPEYKAWKKAINIVLREASTHKNANIFMQKVTNDVAPGYLDIVQRPTDLSQIKKNIENGLIRTTEEFHREIMIMFQNAIMYNKSDHDVYQMAEEMQQDVTEKILAFMLTQSNDKDVVTEPASSKRGTRTSQKGKQMGSKIKEETEKE